jgi:sporulation protein YlmC with PRC-barrel domain
MKLTDILSKEVISVFNGKNEGTVLNVCFDKNLKKLTYLIILTDEDEEKLLQVENIYRLGKVVIIKNSDLLEPIPNVEKEIVSNNPINKKCYSLSTEDYGIIKDIEIDENFQTKSILANQELKILDLISFNEILIFNDLGKKMIKSYFKPRFINNNSNTQTVNILLKENNNSNNNEIEEKNDKILIKNEQNDDKDKKKFSFNISTSLPNKSYTENLSLLLGRKVTKNIMTQNNEIIARKNATITDKMLLVAKANQKIKELSIYSI